VHLQQRGGRGEVGDGGAPHDAAARVLQRRRVAPRAHDVQHGGGVRQPRRLRRAAGQPRVQRESYSERQTVGDTVRDNSERHSETLVRHTRLRHEERCAPAPPSRAATRPAPAGRRVPWGLGARGRGCTRATPTIKAEEMVSK
jgi:hypothetical protein